MKIAVINETSAAAKNAAIIEALSGRGYDIINLGMKESGGHELTYIHTGFLTGLVLNAGLVDYVVGGCGTGQGYLNAAMQYPGVFCGLITESLDGWLFNKINGGNSVSLALNKGFGWAGDVNLRFIFDRLFDGEAGCGYPEHRKDSQQASRRLLAEISQAAHPHYADLIKRLPAGIAAHSVAMPGVAEFLDAGGLSEEIRSALRSCGAVL